MIIGLLATTALGRPVSNRPRSNSVGNLLPWLGVGFFTLMTLASGSRAGLVLLCIALPAALFLSLASAGLIRGMLVFAGSLTLIGVVILLYPGTNTLAVRESFWLGDDARTAYYPDLLYTLEQFWPVGSGLGTFVTAFGPNESLDLAQRAYLNHAHNDFLELLIEAGVFGAAVIALGMGLLAWRAIRSLQSEHQDSRLVAGATLILLLIGLHSLVDYPLRTAAIASAFGLLAGFLVPPTAACAPAQRGLRLWLCIIPIMIAVLVAVQALRLHIVQWSIRDDRPRITAALAPEHPSLLVAEANHHLLANRPAIAERLATRAVELEPMNVKALRALASARADQGKPAETVWQVASLLGWRDAQTQLWAFQQALRNGEPDIAVLRADALLRTTSAPKDFLGVIRVLAQEPAFRASLIERLCIEPPWRRSFFTLPDNPPQAEVEGVFAVIGDQSARNSGIFSRADARSLVAHLLDTREYRRAADAHSAVAGDTRPNVFLTDGSFARPAEDYATSSTAFDWRLFQRRGTTAAIDEAAPTSLVLDTDGQRREIAADRHLYLPAGEYQLEYRARSDQQDAFRLRVLCVDGTQALAEDEPAQSAMLAIRQVTFRVEERCPLVRLVIEALPSGSTGSASFDDFKIDKLS